RDPDAALHRAALHRKEAAFQEVPGETEAEAIRDAFLRGAGPQPQQVAAALPGVGGATQIQALSRLQQEHGNAFVQRIVTETRRSLPPVGDQAVQRQNRPPGEEDEEPLIQRQRADEESLSA
ncbi:MAG: hypothetical protein ACRDI2_07225, partial [Chloroflexota bacterium]